MNQNAIKEILTKHKIVAVVGLSKDTGKDSRRVSSYLKQHDFRVMSVNPFADKVLGEKATGAFSMFHLNSRKQWRLLTFFDLRKMFHPEWSNPSSLKQPEESQMLYG